MGLHLVAQLIVNGKDLVVQVDFDSCSGLSARDDLESGMDSRVHVAVFFLLRYHGDSVWLVDQSKDTVARLSLDGPVDVLEKSGPSALGFWMILQLSQRSSSVGG